MSKEMRPKGRPHLGPSEGSRADMAYLGNLVVADDEPTQLGQAADVYGVVERAIAQSRQRGGTGNVPRQVAADPGHAPPPPPPPPPPGSPEAMIDQPGFVKVVATVADAPDGARNLPFVNDVDSPIAASYRVLRHRLKEVGNIAEQSARDPYRSHGGGPPSEGASVIAITSPDRFEGKTTCAINLAMALAEHGREKVLLVEANLRFPRLATSLGFVTPSCFGRQMAAHLKDPLTAWEAVAAFFHNLHVLSIDPASVGQFRLSSPGLKLAMDQLRTSGYKHIIVDCPSALGSADVNVIEDSADGVFLVARAGKTTAESVRKAELHLAPANIIGIVLM